MSDVFVVGALHLDVVVDAPRLPALDETLFGKHVAYRFGGKGGNQALAAARMGASVAMAGRVGQDGFADQVLATLRSSGVDHSQVRQGPGATGMSVAIVEAGGEYGAVVVSGVNQMIEPAEVDPGTAEIVLLQNEIPEAVNLALAEKAGAATVILNAAPARDTSTALLHEIDVLVVNRVEASQMSGTEDAKAAACALAKLGPKTVIVTCGADGAFVFDGKTLHHVQPPLRATGSAHGAGDAFVGALAAEMSNGQDLISAVSFASIAAAHFVQTPPEKREQITRTAAQAWRANLDI